jgi:hypothetical protein
VSYTYKNWCKTPIFEDGDTGYWSAGAGATIATSTDHFVSPRTKSLKMTVNGTSGVLAVTPTGSAGVPVRMGEAIRLSGWGARTTMTYSGGGTHVIGPFYIRGHIQDASGTILQTVQYQLGMSTSGTGMTRTTGTTNLTADQAGYLVLDIYNAGNSTGGSVYVDGIQVELRDEYFVFASSTAPFFSGASADDADFTYDWDGTAGDSYSTATMSHTVSGPALATIGSLLTVTGSGYAPGETVTVQVEQPYGSATITLTPTADGSGNFSVDATPPAGDSYPGLLRYLAKGPSDTYNAIQLAAIRSAAPAPSTTMTNLFPNPEVVTVASGSRPKHFWQLYDADQISQSGTSGSESARVAKEPTGTSAAITLGETYDDAFSCGMEAGKSYMFSATMTTPVDLDPDEEFYIEASGEWGDSYFDYKDGLAAGSIRLNTPCHVELGAGSGNLFLWADGLNEGRELFMDKVQLTEITQWYRGLMPTVSGTVDLAAMGLQAGSSYYVRSDRPSTVTQPGDTFQILAGPDEGSLTAVHTRAITDEYTWHVVDIPADAVIIRAVGSMTKLSLIFAWQIAIFDAPPAYFSGDTTDGGGYTYAWAGTPNDSASIRTDAPAGLEGQFFADGEGVAFSEARIVIDGDLVNITQIGE